MGSDGFFFIPFIITLIVAFCCGIYALISWKLIKGIDERNPSKVAIYKYFSIIKLVLYIIGMLSLMFNTKAIIRDEEEMFYGNGPHRNNEPSGAEQLISSIIMILWSLYEIFVIDSLEKMYREQPSSMTPPSAGYQAHPQQQQGHVVITPYYAPDFNNATGPYATTPPSYPQNPPPFNPSMNNHPEKL